MKPHRWAKEIKAWADGAEIECRLDGDDEYVWLLTKHPAWESTAFEYRVKPQPKEPQYLYVYRTDEGDVTFEFGEGVEVVGYRYIGKIKLEQDDE